MKQDPSGDGVRSGHLSVLEAVDGRGNVSQRSLAEKLGMAASGVNRVIRELLESGHLEVVDESVRPFAYRLTSNGQGYLRRLSHQHYRTLLEDLRRIRARIRRRLREIRDQGLRRLVFYGAGEIMELTLPLSRELDLEVVAVVDDDEEKQGQEKAGATVLSPGFLDEVEADAVVITTWRHGEEIRERLAGENAYGARILQL